MKNEKSTAPKFVKSKEDNSKTKQTGNINPDKSVTNSGTNTDRERIPDTSRSYGITTTARLAPGGEVIEYRVPAIKKQFTREKHLRPNDYEIPRHGSMTIPDQSMTIPEIQARFASGLPYTAGRVPVYEGEEDILFDGINPLTLDLSEKMAIVADYVSKGHNARLMIKEAREKARNERQRNEMEADLRKQIEDEPKSSEKTSTKIP